MLTDSYSIKGGQLPEMACLTLNAGMRLIDIGVIPPLLEDDEDYWSSQWGEDEAGILGDLIDMLETGEKELGEETQGGKSVPVDSEEEAVAGDRTSGEDAATEPEADADALSTGEDTQRRIVRIALTGAPCSGKTASVPMLAKALNEQGWHVLLVPENATLSFGGGAPPGKTVDRTAYQARLAKLAIALEDFFMAYAQEQLPGRDVVLLCDRGTIDSYSFLPSNEWGRFEEESGHSREGLLSRYDVVAILESASAIGLHTQGNNDARSEDAETSLAMDESTKDAWSGHPHVLTIASEESFESKVHNLIRQVTQAIGISGDVASPAFSGI